MNSTDTGGGFAIVGVGPGDPELLTFKAALVLGRAELLIAPKARENGNSSALEIAAGVVDFGGKEIVEVHFPMKKVFMDPDRTPEPEVMAAWRRCAELVREQVAAGRRVAFPVLGDPSLYATSAYVHAQLLALAPNLEVEIVPGISAMSSCAAAVGRPLGLGNDLVTIVPAAFADERLRRVLAKSDSVVLMKVHRRLPALVALLDEAGRLGEAVLVERCGFAGQRIHRDLRATVGLDVHYFSTILVRREASFTSP